MMLLGKNQEAIEAFQNGMKFIPPHTLSAAYVEAVKGIIQRLGGNV